MTNVDFSPKPYRVERRLYIGRCWILVAETDSHDEALRIARESIRRFEGYVRVITQHVIERFQYSARQRR